MLHIDEKVYFSGVWINEGAHDIFVVHASDLGPNTLKSIQIHYNYFDLSMITITLQLQDL